MDDLHGPGLGASQRTLLERLKRRGESTLAELEEGSELARETLRSHLASLAEQGLVERAGLRRAGPGRPRVVYRLTPRGEALFPRREGELLAELAGHLLERGDRELLERFFTERVERKRTALTARCAGLDEPGKLREIARALSEEGFLAEERVMPGRQAELRLCHCPVRALVDVTQLPCRAEMNLVEEILGRPLERRSFIPDGAPSCTYVVLPRRDAKRPRRQAPKTR